MADNSSATCICVCTYVPTISFHSQFVFLYTILACLFVFVFVCLFAFLFVTPLLCVPHCRYGQLCVDPQLKVFDLRMQRPIPPVDVTMLQPFLIRCVPALDSTVLVLSQLGEFQYLNLHGLVTPSSMVVPQLMTASCGGGGGSGAVVAACSMDVSPSWQCLAFGDSSGAVHLWSNGEEPVMNSYAQPTVFPNEVRVAIIIIV